MIQIFTKCEECAHIGVCAYKGIQKETMNKMEGYLDNIYVPEFFEFSFKCREYKKIEPTIKSKKGD